MMQSQSPAEVMREFLFVIPLSGPLRLATLLLLGDLGLVHVGRCIFGAGNQGEDLQVQGWVLPVWPWLVMLATVFLQSAWS